jgi:hypothetical protein
MHLTQAGYEQQYQIVGADGTVLWQGGAIIGQALRVNNLSATVAIASGGAVIADGNNSTYTRDDNLSTNDPMVLAVAGLAVVSASSNAFLGFAVEKIPQTLTGTPAKSGRVASTGSVGAVRVTSAAVNVGDSVGGSATAGLCATIAPATYAATSGLVLGICVKAGSQMGTSGLYAAGVLVAQK